MDLTVPPEAEAFRERLRRFLRDNLPPGWAGIGALDESKRLAFGRRWRELVSREGLLAVSWPREYGGAGLGPLEQFILAEEFIAAGVPLRPLPGDQHGLSPIGPTILQAGNGARMIRPRGKWSSSPRAATIYGGSSQIQRNLLAERVLGLPRQSARAAR
jgi:alkylation response protein AidB-like acyl-CoA dehydrogenase